jgi:hypothetical protein
MTCGGVRALFVGLALALAFNAVTVARERPSTLPPPDPEILRLALWLTGDYDGVFDGKPTRKDLTEPLKVFRARAGLPAGGDPTAADVAALRAAAAQAATSLGLEPAIDAANNIVLQVPRTLLPNTGRGQDGRHFASEDGQAVLTTFAKPGGRPVLGQLRDELLASHPGDPAALTADSLSFTGKNRETVVHVRAFEIAGMVKGIRFTYPTAQAPRYARAARYMLAAVDPRPQLPQRPAALSVAALERLASPRGEASAVLKPGEALTAQATRGRVSARLSLTKHPEDPAREPPQPMLEVKADDTTVASVQVASIARTWTSAVAEVAPLDPKAALPAVVFAVSADVDGCCTEVRIAIAAENGWRTLEAGPFRGVPRLLADPERPGGQVLAGELSAFHDAFGPSEIATAPLTILRLDGEWLNDVTRDAAFRPLHALQLAASLAEAKAGAFRANSVWPGIIGSARLTGEGDEAAALMEAHHDPAATQGREICVSRMMGAVCPADRIRTRPLAAAIDSLLSEAGFGP